MFALFVGLACGSLAPASLEVVDGTILIRGNGAIVSSPTPAGFKLKGTSRSGPLNLTVTWTSPKANWTRRLAFDGSDFQISTIDTVTFRTEKPMGQVYATYTDGLQATKLLWRPVTAGFVVQDSCSYVAAYDEADCARPMAGTGPGTVAFGMVGPNGTPTSLPKNCVWKGTLVFGASDEVWKSASSLAWARFGRPRMESAMPQSVPLAYSAHTVCTFGITGEEEGKEGEAQEEDLDSPWWKGEWGDVRIGCPRVEKVFWGRGRDSMRAAWGMMWWGRKLGFEEWRERAEELVHLTLVRPRKDSAYASGFSPEGKQWSYGEGSGDEYHTGYWLARWITDFGFDGPEETEKATKILSVLAEKAKASNRLLQDELDRAQRRIIWDERAKFLALVSNVAAVDNETRASSSDAFRAYSKLLARAYSQNVFQLGSDRDPVGECLLVPSLPLLQVALKLTGEQRLYDSASWGSPTGQFATDDLVGSSVSMMRAGARLSDRHLFERGVVALKADIRKLQDPYGILNLIFPNPNVPFGSSQVGYWRNGAVHRKYGFERGEGQFAANLAEATSEFGGMFTLKTGETVGIDGCRLSSDGRIVSLFGKNRTPFSGAHQIDRVQEDGQRSVETIERVPAVNRLGLRFVGSKLYVLAVVGSSGASNQGISGTFTVPAAKWSSAAKVAGRGFESEISIEALGKGPVSFRGVIGTEQLEFGPETLRLAPPVEIRFLGTQKWVRRSIDTPIYSPSLSKGRRALLSTADNGSGKADPGLMMDIASQPFFARSGSLSFDLLPATGTGVSVTLRDTETNETVASIVPQRTTRHIEWDMAKYKGRHLEVLLKDSSRTSSVSLSRVQFRTSKSSRA